MRDAGALVNRCACGGALLARYRTKGPSVEALRARPAGPWRYQELLPLHAGPVSLGEVATPLLRLERLSERWGVSAYLKDEGPLPGGTFKARGAAVGLSRALELGAASLVMPSAGNAGGAWSLYAARAGVPLTVTMAASAPAVNKDEVRLAGGQLVLVDGSISDAAARARSLADATGAFLVATFAEPYRVEGKKTAWLEVFDQLGAESGDAGMVMPATVIVPVGGGVGAVAAAKAADEVLAMGWASGRAPVIVGVQSAGCAPLVAAFERGAAAAAPWPHATSTIAAGLRVPAPSEGDLVLAAVRASGGVMLAAGEEEMIVALRTLASSEGIAACPEGAVTVVGAERLARAGKLAGPVVLYNTGAAGKYLAMLEDL